MRDRIIAASIHLSISLLLAGLILVLLFVIWFPSPLMSLGAVQGVQLILLVDLAIGPFLTLIIFKKGKPSLVFDMSVIVILQLSALLYGVSAIYGQTPAYLVMTHEGLYVVSRYEVKNFISPKGLSIPDEVANDPVRYQGRVPVYLLPQPENIDERGLSNVRFQFDLGLPYHFNATAYQPLASIEYLLATESATETTNSDGQVCTNISMISGHGEAEVCLYQRDQKLQLAN